MNKLYDANVIYNSGTKAVSGSKWKYETQKFRGNQLLETAHIQRQLYIGYRPSVGNRFIVNERGHTRYITSASISDKTVIHAMCDEIISPSIKKYLQYDNSASQKGKGVSFHRRRLETNLHKYYHREKTNKGYILFIDFSGYYANIHHDKCKNILIDFISRETDRETEKIAEQLISEMFSIFAIDVSRFPDSEIETFMHTKIDPMMNIRVSKSQLTGQKFLHKGLDIGNQLSQDCGIVYPYQIDNFIKIVRGIKEFGRYTDDFYALHRSKDVLLDLLTEIYELSDQLGLIINKKKTKIYSLSEYYRHLQIQYSLTNTGRVIKKINPKTITRERRKLKAYKRQLEAGKMAYNDIENYWKSWIGTQWKYMSKEQIKNMSRLYRELFGRDATWKKHHGRLRWLMAQ